MLAANWLAMGVKPTEVLIVEPGTVMVVVSAGAVMVDTRV